jgi:predicted DCC family thiol-disulfide oxidoreductase YuxK
MSQPELTLFYDGLCPLCSREVAYYRTRAAGDPGVRFVDIADPAFDARRHGLDPAAVHRRLHVKVGDEVRVGVEAFVALWERLRGFGWIARVARWPGVNQTLRLAYAGFARVRPLLPRRRAACDTGACRR